eukprot:COSAG02_NODE_48953_length_330_cov_0.865801_1_plen_47_part_01
MDVIQTFNKRFNEEYPNVIVCNGLREIEIYSQPRDSTPKHNVRLKPS